MDEENNLGISESAQVPPTITFHSDNDAEPVSVLYLDVTDGKLKFKGDMDESSKIFFENILKPMCDDYIEKQLKNEI